MSGALRDTYVAALQHDTADLPDDAVLVGVVRRPTRWFSVDENLPALGPPSDLLDEFKQAHEDLKADGMADAAAHDAAWEDLDFADRYESYLDSSSEAQAAIERVEEMLADGETVALVCFENTEQKRCHRTLLKAYIQDRIRSS